MRSVIGGLSAILMAAAVSGCAGTGEALSALRTLTVGSEIDVIWNSIGA